ncbi:ester cyclase [Halomarina rubra]|uniref:Ester cyclase n=1 Tax=Halomarina rubra TaxID=2071873 RepID=A0ABD6APR5_9EURY|nr:ester cyclase [Halomarina rubra]
MSHCADGDPPVPADAGSDTGSDARPDIERVSRRDFEEVWHEQDPSVIPDLYHADYRGHGFPLLGTVSRTGYRRVSGLFLRAFPDIRFDIHRLDSATGRVETDWTFEATHSGWVGPLPPSGARISVDGWGRHRYEGDRVAETWLDLDWADLAGQLGRGYLAAAREKVGTLV